MVGQVPRRAAERLSRFVFGPVARGLGPVARGASGLASRLVSWARARPAPAVVFGIGVVSLVVVTAMSCGTGIGDRGGGEADGVRRPPDKMIDGTARPAGSGPTGAEGPAAPGTGGGSPGEVPTDAPGAGPASSGAGTGGTKPAGGSSTGGGAEGPSVPAAPDGCATGTVTLTAQQNRSPAPICLRAGATLAVSSNPSPPRPWQPLTTSNGAVITCTSAAGRNGSIAGTCVAARAGSAVVATRTAETGQGGPGFTWQVTVNVYP